MIAFDIAFKLVFSLNAKYPPESKSAWLFIQRAIYKIKILNDRLPLKVTELLGILRCLN